MTLTVLLSPSECSLSHLDELKRILSACPGRDEAIARYVTTKGVQRLNLGVRVDAKKAKPALRDLGWVVGG
jgi:hypothetical protein